MQLLRIARSYLRQAEARLEDAKDALSEGNYPYAVRLSQECVELSLKAALRAVGIDYPKVHEVHDVSDVLADVSERFPEWFRAEMDFLCESSKILAKKREISLYEGEEAFLAPEDVISREDADDAVERAIRVYSLCRKFIDEIESKG